MLLVDAREENVALAVCVRVMERAGSGAEECVLASRR